MKRLTVKNLCIQMDLPDDQLHDLEGYSRNMIDIINLTLQREPYGLATRIIPPGTPLKLKTEDL